MANIGSLSATGYGFYNGGWSSMNTTFKTSYSQTGKYVTINKIKTPSFTQAQYKAPYSFTIDVDMLKGSTSYSTTSGTLYVYLCESNPMGTQYSTTPSPTQAPSSYIGYGTKAYSGLTNNIKSFQVTVNISSTTLKSNTSYYLWIQTSSWTQIQYGSGNPPVLGNLQGTLITYPIYYRGNGYSLSASGTKTHGVDYPLKSFFSDVNSYQIAYNLNGGTSTTPSTQRSTLKQIKWNPQSDGSGTDRNAGYKQQNNASVTWYAKWQQNSVTLASTPSKSSSSSTYSITYNNNGGQGTISNSSLIRTTSYSFTGWAQDSTSGTKRSAGATFTPPYSWGQNNSAKTITMYATWSSSKTGSVTIKGGTGFSKSNTTSNGYTVTFNGNGATTNSKASQTAINTTSYSFNGWNTNTAGTGTNYAASATYSGNSNLTLYAKWAPSTTKGSVTLPTRTQCQRTGYYLLGFNTSSTATTAAYAPGSSYKPNGNITLFAIWQANTYQIKYNGNGATSGSMSNSTHTYGVSKSLTNNAFLRQYIVTYNYNGGSALEPNRIVNSTFLYWTKTSNYTTPHYLNGQPVSNLTSTNGATVNLFAQWNLGKVTLPTPQRQGYTFKHWNDGLLGGSQITPTQNVTLTAKWQANTYYVKYNGNGATSGTMSRSTHTYDVQKALTKNTYQKKYSVQFEPNGGNSSLISKTAIGKFKGWSTSSLGSVVYADEAPVKNLTTTNNTEFPLYAKWEDGVITAPTAQEFTKTGYTLRGFGESATSNTITVKPGASYTPSNNKTLYAIWLADADIPYEVEYWCQNIGGNAAEHNSTNYTKKTTVSYTGTADTSVTPTIPDYPGFTTPDPQEKIIEADGSTVFKYYYTRNKYSIKIYPNGGSWQSSTESSRFNLFYNDKRTLEIPTRPGYLFCGWYKTAYGTLDQTATKSPLFTVAAELPRVYNNSGDGSVTHSCSAGTDGGYQRIITITTTGNTAKPERGGFITYMTSEQDKEYIHVFRAKAPTGTSLKVYHNLGTQGSVQWLTDNKGTGEWEDYAYKMISRVAGKTFGHVALKGGPASGVTWYLTGSQITESPDTTKQQFTVGAGDTNLYAQWIPWGSVKIYVDSVWKMALPYVYINGAWQRALPYVNENGTPTGWKMCGG